MNWNNLYEATIEARTRRQNLRTPNLNFFAARRRVPGGSSEHQPTKAIEKSRPIPQSGGRATNMPLQAAPNKFVFPQIRFFIRTRADAQRADLRV
jgi:hypothetical protein